MEEEVPTASEISQQEVEERAALGLQVFTQMVRSSPGGMLLPTIYKKLAKAYHSLKFRSDDVVLMTHMKAGTVWTSEIIWAMHNLDQLHLADRLTINQRHHYLPYDLITRQHHGEVHHEFLRRLEKQCPGATPEDGLVLQLADAHAGPSPRFLGTHLPFCLHHPGLLDTCKVVYVARNPKDVCCSFYNFFHSLGNFKGEFSNFAELFMKDGVMFGPYWEHLRQAWQRKDHPNLHIMFFEDMKEDIMAQLAALNRFLGLNLNQDQLQRVAEHTRLNNMKAREEKNPIYYNMNNTFFHSGTIGGWSKMATPEIDKKMNEWIAHNSKDLDITFKYK